MDEPTTPPDTGEPTIPPIGEEIARRRLLAGWTQDELAEHAGLSPDVVRRLEQGRRLSVRLTTLIRIATALDVPLGVLLEAQQGLPRDGTSVAPRPAVLALRDALMPPPGTSSDAHPLPVNVLTARLDELAGAYRQGAITSIGRALPELVGTAEATAAETGGPAAATALSRAYTLAAKVCVQWGYEDLAYATLVRAYTAAERAGDRLAAAHAQVALSWLYLRQGRWARAVTIALEGTEPLARGHGPAGAYLYGAGLWHAITALARQGDAAQAAELLAELTALAAPVNLAWSSWPDLTRSALAAKAVSTAVEAGEDGRALELAGRVPPWRPGHGQPLTHARYLLDLGQAQCRAGRTEAAAETLLAAQDIAPEWVRYQVLARELARALTDKWPGRSIPERLRRLAVELGVA